MEIKNAKPKHKLTLNVPNCQVEEDFSDCCIPARSNSDGSESPLQNPDEDTTIFPQVTIVSKRSVDEKNEPSKFKTSVIDSKSTVKIKNTSNDITNEKLPKESKPKFNIFSSSPPRLNSNRNSVANKEHKNILPIKDRSVKVPPIKVRQETLNDVKRKFKSKQYHDTSSK